MFRRFLCLVVPLVLVGCAHSRTPATIDISPELEKMLLYVFSVDGEACRAKPTLIVGCQGGIEMTTSSAKCIRVFADGGSPTVEGSVYREMHVLNEDRIEYVSRRRIVDSTNRLPGGVTEIFETCLH